MNGLSLTETREISRGMRKLTRTVIVFGIQYVTTKRDHQNLQTNKTKVLVLLVCKTQDFK